MVNIGFFEIKFFKQLSLLVFENYKTTHFQRNKLLIFFSPLQLKISSLYPLVYFITIKVYIDLLRFKPGTPQNFTLSEISLYSYNKFTVLFEIITVPE